MRITLTFANTTYKADLSQGHDITITLDSSLSTPKCFYAPDLRIEPVVAEGFVGDIARGGIINFKNISINPHGNGTHTECVGHIIAGKHYISESLRNHHWISQLVSINPSVLENGDTCILLTDLQSSWVPQPSVDALIIRTLPNDASKQKLDYSGQNPTYIHADAMHYIREMGIKHLLVDLPSVDREEDDALFAAHKAFWAGDTGEYDTTKTITELVYIDNDIHDGLYLCAIYPLRLMMDASPSRVVIYGLDQY
jgi:arylformamidase